MTSRKSKPSKSSAPEGSQTPKRGVKRNTPEPGVRNPAAEPNPKKQKKETPPPPPAAYVTDNPGTIMPQSSRSTKTPSRSPSRAIINEPEFIRTQPTRLAKSASASPVPESSAAATGATAKKGGAKKKPRLSAVGEEQETIPAKKASKKNWAPVAKPAKKGSKKDSTPEAKAAQPAKKGSKDASPPSEKPAKKGSKNDSTPVAKPAKSAKKGSKEPSPLSETLGRKDAKKDSTPLTKPAKPAKKGSKDASPLPETPAKKGSKKDSTPLETPAKLAMKPSQDDLAPVSKITKKRKTSPLEQDAVDASSKDTKPKGKRVKQVHLQEDKREEFAENPPISSASSAEIPTVEVSEQTGRNEIPTTNGLEESFVSTNLTAAVLKDALEATSKCGKDATTTNSDDTFDNAFDRSQPPLVPQRSVNKSSTNQSTNAATQNTLGTDNAAPLLRSEPRSQANEIKYPAFEVTNKTSPKFTLFFRPDVYGTHKLTFFPREIKRLDCLYRLFLGPNNIVYDKFTFPELLDYLDVFKLWYRWACANISASRNPPRSELKSYQMNIPQLFRLYCLGEFFRTANFCDQIIDLIISALAGGNSLTCEHLNMIYKLSDRCTPLRRLILDMSTAGDARIVQKGNSDGPCIEFLQENRLLFRSLGGFAAKNKKWAYMDKSKWCHYHIHEKFKVNGIFQGDESSEDEQCLEKEWCYTGRVLDLDEAMTSEFLDREVSDEDSESSSDSDNFSDSDDSNDSDNADNACGADHTNSSDSDDSDDDDDDDDRSPAAKVDSDVDCNMLDAPMMNEEWENIGAQHEASQTSETPAVHKSQGPEVDDNDDCEGLDEAMNEEWDKIEVDDEASQITETGQNITIIDAINQDGTNGAAAMDELPDAPNVDEMNPTGFSNTVGDDNINSPSAENIGTVDDSIDFDNNENNHTSAIIEGTSDGSSDIGIYGGLSSTLTRNENIKNERFSDDYWSSSDEESDIDAASSTNSGHQRRTARTGPSKEVITASCRKSELDIPTLYDVNENFFREIPEPRDDRRRKVAFDRKFELVKFNGESIHTKSQTKGDTCSKSTVKGAIKSALKRSSNFCGAPNSDIDIGKLMASVGEDTRLGVAEENKWSHARDFKSKWTKEMLSLPKENRIHYRTWKLQQVRAEERSATKDVESSDSDTDADGEPDHDFCRKRLRP
ncbi:hypothetical protein M501DRAFT_113247 [Patellaria atrata CBS 101060]|uniref:Uncharacterized protein n=1 Tax=Patellaria atrata CBS 101060 TaxID=1346257 RepID=A0A9P4SKQ9_9PEZI|nr:hypothetical protein M501DRAFT_113247 [Patellaria atrata CBS 101060]